MLETETLTKRSVHSPRATTNLCIAMVTALATIASVAVPLSISRPSFILPAVGGTLLAALAALLLVYLFVASDYFTGRVLELSYPAECTTLEVECFEDVGDGWFSGSHYEPHVQLAALSHSTPTTGEQPFWMLHAEPSCCSRGLQGTHRVVSIYDDRAGQPNVGDVVRYRRTGFGETLEVIARAAA